MTAKTLNADNAAQKNESKPFSIKYNNQWTTEDQVANASCENATFQMELSGEIIALNQPRPSPAGRSGGKNPASVARRNARERRRIKNVNSAFDELRQHVPHGDRNRKKISKVDTLQSAIEYIKALEDLVRSRRKSVLPSEEGQHIVKSLSKKPTDNNDFVSPVSPIFPESEGEKSAFGQYHGQDEFEAKETNQKGTSVNHRPSEITESMLKAFDIMLQQKTLKRTSSLPEAIPCKRSTPNEAIVVEADQTPSACADNLLAQSSDSGYCDVFQSSEPRNDQAAPVLHAVVPSPEVEYLTPESEPHFTQYRNYYDASVEDPSVGSEYTLDMENNNSSADTPASGSLLDAETENWSPAHTESQVSAEWNSNATEQWPVDVSHSNDVQNGSEFFDFQSSSVPTNIDQINPSIDFLPESDDFPHYTDTVTSLPMMAGFEQMNTSFANQPSSETCWVLAQLN